MNLSELANHFPESDIEWRIQSSGKNSKGLWAKCLAYVTNRAIMERLDAVCGIDGWKNEFKESPSGGILCGISIKCDDEWITKWDGADNTKVEAVKGGLSSAMKRAGVQWGIGRYLYDLDIGWAKIIASGVNSAQFDKEWFNWNPPKLPVWALPEVISKELAKDYASRIFRFNEDKDAEGISQLVDELDTAQQKVVWNKMPHDIHEGVRELLETLK